MTADPLRIRTLFEAGKDTVEIAERLLVPEAMVANALAMVNDGRAVRKARMALSADPAWKATRDARRDAHRARMLRRARLATLFASGVSA